MLLGKSENFGSMKPDQLHAFNNNNFLSAIFLRQTMTRRASLQIGNLNRMTIFKISKCKQKKNEDNYMLFRYTNFQPKHIISQNDQ